MSARKIASSKTTSKIDSASKRLPAPGSKQERLGRQEKQEKEKQDQQEKQDSKNSIKKGDLKKKVLSSPVAEPTDSEENEDAQDNKKSSVKKGDSKKKVPPPVLEQVDSQENEEAQDIRKLSGKKGDAKKKVLSSSVIEPTDSQMSEEAQDIRKSSVKKGDSKKKVVSPSAIAPTESLLSEEAQLEEEDKEQDFLRLKSEQNTAAPSSKGERYCWEEWRDFYYEVWGCVTKKADLLVAVIHYILTRNNFLCIGLGDDKMYSTTDAGSKSLPDGWNDLPKYAIRYMHKKVLYLLLGVCIDNRLTVNLLNTRSQIVTNITVQPERLVHAMCGGFITTLIPDANKFALRLTKEFVEPAISDALKEDCSLPELHVRRGSKSPFEELEALEPSQINDLTLEAIAAMQPSTKRDAATHSSFVAEEEEEAEEAEEEEEGEVEKSKEDSKEELKEEPKEELKEESKEELKDESKDGSKGEQSTSQITWASSIRKGVSDASTATTSLQDLPAVSSRKQKKKNNTASTVSRPNEPSNGSPLAAVKDRIAPLREAIVRYVQVMAQIMGLKANRVVDAEPEQLLLLGQRKRQDLLNQYIRLVQQVRGDTTIEPPNSLPLSWHKQESTLGISLSKTFMAAGDMLNNSSFEDIAVPKGNAINKRSSYVTGSADIVAASDDQAERKNEIERAAGGSIRPRRDFKVKFNLEPVKTVRAQRLMRSRSNDTTILDNVMENQNLSRGKLEKGSERKGTRTRNKNSTRKVCKKKSGQIPCRTTISFELFMKWRRGLYTKPSMKFRANRSEHKKDKNSTIKNSNSKTNEKTPDTKKSSALISKFEAGNSQQQLNKSNQAIKANVSTTDSTEVRRLRFGFPQQLRESVERHINRVRNTQKEKVQPGVVKEKYRETGGIINEVKSNLSAVGCKIANKSGILGGRTSKIAAGDSRMESKYSIGRHNSNAAKSYTHLRKSKSAKLRSKRERTEKTSEDDPYKLETVEKNFAMEIEAKRLELLARARHDPIGGSISSVGSLSSISYNEPHEDDGDFVPPADEWSEWQFQKTLIHFRDRNRCPPRKLNA